MSTERRAMFVGSKEIGLMTLQTLTQTLPGLIVSIVTYDDSVDSRSVLPQLKAYCQRTNLPLTVIQKPSELGHVIREWSPYVVFVVGWYWIINQKVLDMVPGGFIGVHASLLPKYRGNAPLVWAVLRGDDHTGISMFYFESGMDTGDIVAQADFPITFYDTIAEVLMKAQQATADLIAQYARQLLEGQAPRKKQRHDLATYVSLRRPEDGRITWGQSALQIYNFIRAQTRPYPGAFTTLPDGRYMRIWRAVPFPYPFYGIPGLVGQRHADGVVVTSGEGAIVVQECQIEGMEVIPAEKVLTWGMRLS
jgi:methionyl-tRNA formyltransferase